MLSEIAAGVHVHRSMFILSNAVVVQGRDGVLLVDPGVQEGELACLADDVRGLGRPVVAGFSTHPHWDHLLWHDRLGSCPRYCTPRCAAAVLQELADPEAHARITEHLAETGLAGKVPLELYGLVTALPAAATHIPWDGPPVRMVEHQAHAPGHAALLVEESGLLVAGDMLSDVLVPMLGQDGADPIEDYLAALALLEGVAGDVDFVVPGHGTVGGPFEVQARIDLDRAYLHALRDGGPVSDPRIGPSAKPGWEWVSDVHEGQAERFQR